MESGLSSDETVLKDIHSVEFVDQFYACGVLDHPLYKSPFVFHRSRLKKYERFQLNGGAGGHHNKKASSLC